MQHKALRFYLGLKNEPRFGPAGPENVKMHAFAFSTCVYSVLQLSLTFWHVGSIDYTVCQGLWPQRYTTRGNF